MEKFIEKAKGWFSNHVGKGEAGCQGIIIFYFWRNVKYNSLIYDVIIFCTNPFADYKINM